MLMKQTSSMTVFAMSLESKIAIALETGKLTELVSA